ncbi:MULTISPECIES: 3-oxoadipate enol-lactonase [Prauserella salsuginis group]|uniref:3-oxoadipate enol-lactonase n=2 Tax=Prauserella salsuginis group TaxID=2893672 RepID=A0A839XZK2_9PSEU|nr:MULTISPECIES: 3-oxoadipate enol-lactonase [Prauserella salsuginis group]MBB3665823.1 3-oxoadipate enol-lactonase [Prauserella sediminis]MCR3718807.1 3-oxoadipate enol-lactonase [Prauserella flava]MCR3733377.1 3-oxoadipate enol-lactonase [Prauserella salsuginis]
MQVHSEVEGPADGDVVVLSGSIGSNLTMWQPQVEPLVRAGYRVVRYDQRGHGRTGVPDGDVTMADLGGDVVELLDGLGVDRAHFVGLSLGGMTGMWLGIHAPERLRSLVLCCTSAKLGTPESWAERGRVAREQGMTAIADGSVERWFTPGWLAAHPQARREYHHMTAATPAAGYAACCHAIGTMDLLDGLPSIPVPTLVVAGADDPATPPDGHGRVIADAVPDARLEVVPDAAHLGNVEQPERFTELITTHLAKA